MNIIIIPVIMLIIVGAIPLANAQNLTKEPVCNQYIELVTLQCIVMPWGNETASPIGPGMQCNRCNSTMS